MSRRFNLREFQQNLSERLQASNLQAEQATALGIQIGHDAWLVEMQDISEVLPVPPLAPVPLTQSWYCGLSNVRGNLYSIVDLAMFLGTEEDFRDAANRILLVAPQYESSVGLLVTRVLGLRHTESWKQVDMDGDTRYLDEQGSNWRKLDIAGLVTKPEFLAIGS